MKPQGAYFLFFLVFGSVLVQAQTECPTINVSGPAGVVEPGKLMPFSAEIKPFDAEKMKLVWTLSSPDSAVYTIESGQGTHAIAVRTKPRTGINVTATLTIEGLPAGCKNSDSDTGGVAVCFLPVPLDEYGPLNAKDEDARLANAAFQLKDQPDTIALFQIFYPPSISRDKIAGSESRILRQLAKFGSIPPDRIRFSYENSPNMRTVIYIYPTVADFPIQVVSLDSFRPLKAPPKR